MDWLNALWLDLSRHIHEFEIGPPRTVDQLVAWFGLFGILYAAYKSLRRIADKIKSRFGGPIAKFRAAASKVERFQSDLNGLVHDGLFQPSLAPVALMSLIYVSLGTIFGGLAMLTTGFLFGGGWVLSFALAGSILLAAMFRNMGVNIVAVIAALARGRGSLMQALVDGHRYLGQGYDHLFVGDEKLTSEREKLRQNVTSLIAQIDSIRAQCAIPKPPSVFD